MRTLSIAAIILAATASIPAIAEDTTPKPGVISVSATGNADVAPDMAILNLMVMREAETARAALDANTQAMAAVLTDMKAEGIDERDLQTSNFNINPRYFYPPRKNDGTQKPPRIVGYVVTNGLTVRVRDLGKLGTILDRSVTLGVNSGGNVRFANDDPAEAINQARKNAMENAIAKATMLTETAGIGLARITQISEQNRGRPRPQAMAMARSKMAADEAAPVPIAAGENSYSVTVNVTWELAQ
ncbi:SIMPL domain-containing protein [Ahrensia sp. R2A130]|uniref:SIMPL domain-containing protein n=1 Tax=Ahrensia sp. R2A130 TaxID=744979 RepID=UPI0001E08BE0|nr:SIMPL domain-containing protein [Ahrensia sp. R2A130]EFL91059.1 26 kDa periplasmic immunogenic protein [Ahrensia sp. R2A130]